MPVEVAIAEHGRLAANAYLRAKTVQEGHNNLMKALKRRQKKRR
jgi:hypothetical protein